MNAFDVLVSEKASVLSLALLGVAELICPAHGMPDGSQVTR